MRPRERAAEPEGFAPSDIVDLHSHILPEMDDGAASAQISYEMLSRMAEQGIRAVVSTSHFYPEDEDPAHFLKRRAEAARALRAVYDPAHHPTVYVGAEVAFFSGIARSESMKELCIVGTDSILVEMPQLRWTSDIVHELLMMPFQLGLYPIIAHVERCLPYQSGETARVLLDNGVRLQTNAEHVLDRKTGKRAIKQIACGMISFLGSDAHGIEHRVPNLAPALAAIAARTDARVTERLLYESRCLTASAVPLFDTL